MDIQSLFKMQKELDGFIEKERGIEGADLFQQKLLALLVEIGELANETRCFKFWSSKPASSKDTILEEFVDGVHFILSLGIIKSFDTKKFSIEVSDTQGDDPVKAFLFIYNSVNEFGKNRDLAHYDTLLQAYFSLGNTLGFTPLEVEAAYKKKNEINFRRQHEGY
ncbi:dUTP diphosphatase [Falsibacillus pallidus]|uniref:Dimeric dUTPase (All-alpha-NTP-PPase superfamily) n=1 Tax=Falsibacillus pallidus TaxID=493781 RepID=A0A370GKB4_9BACI|nr:dUTP diphosphatase [Falsibacillus pallidus]RDI44222.1 dimeric dUTPase (all-alpha-NTP-PPase superfamily) [Falsibacillus pallidus]